MPAQSPPFRDSDAIEIITKRLHLVADLMRRHDYGAELERQMTEISEWLEWLATAIAVRNDKDEN